MFGVGLRLCLLQDNFATLQTFRPNLKFLPKLRRKSIILIYIIKTNVRIFFIKMEFPPFSESCPFSHLFPRRVTVMCYSDAVSHCMLCGGGFIGDCSRAPLVNGIIINPFFVVGVLCQTSGESLNITFPSS